jgi:hypothetical protein
MFYLLLKHLHSGLRWIVLIMLIYTILNSVVKLLKKKVFNRHDSLITRLNTSFIHIQFTLGIILYFKSPKVIFSSASMSNDLLRFFLLEHTSLMMIAVVLVTMGYSSIKKISSDKQKHRRVLFFLIPSLILILAAIPWPWKSFAGSWF